MRSRNIKPGFFLNEVLGVADPLIQILFAGLWCMADKEGRLEDRPLRIKAEVFPYRDGLDINGYLTELSRLEFILCYEVDGKAYIQILNFKKHQNPHHTEKKSILPEYSSTCVITRDSPLKHREYPADSMIPDSMIPDSRFTDSPDKMDVSECRELFLKYSGQIQVGGGVTTVFQDICKEYPPDRIREVFQFAGASRPEKFLPYVLGILRNKEPQSKARHKTDWNALVREHEQEAARELSSNG